MSNFKFAIKLMIKVTVRHLGKASNLFSLYFYVLLFNFINKNALIFADLRIVFNHLTDGNSYYRYCLLTFFFYFYNIKSSHLRFIKRRIVALNLVGKDNFDKLKLKIIVRDSQAPIYRETTGHISYTRTTLGCKADCYCVIYLLIFHKDPFSLCSCSNYYNRTSHATFRCWRLCTYPVGGSRWFAHW